LVDTGSINQLHRAESSCIRHGWNGPAAHSGKVGHKLSAIGSPHYAVAWSGFAPRLAALTGWQPPGNRHTGNLQVTPSAHPFSFRLRAHPYRLAASPSRLNASGRKGTMGKEICISSTPHETRLAILEDDQLAEIYYERENEYTLAGSIYNGRVTRVLPGMQSAFVDVGLERDAFLYVTDFLELEDSEESDELEKATIASGNQPPREVRHQSAPAENNGQRAAQKPDREAGSPGRIASPEAAVSLWSPFQKPPRRPPLNPSPSPARPAAPRMIQASSSSRRWRGRRRRRGGSAPAGSPESQSGTDSTEESPRAEPRPRRLKLLRQFKPQPGSQATGLLKWRPRFMPLPSLPTPRAGRSSAPPVPFVLPGESLRKYGGKPEEDAPQSRRTSSAGPSGQHLQACHAD
jgi:ribonuclease E